MVEKWIKIVGFDFYLHKIRQRNSFQIKIERYKLDKKGPNGQIKIGQIMSNEPAAYNYPCGLTGVALLR